MKRAFLQEIFSSIQGEGLWVGERHIFIRFAGCDIHCRYCDTSASTSGFAGEQSPRFCVVSRSREPLRCEQIPNPVSDRVLAEICSGMVISGPSRPTISLTGGEPLLHHDFLQEFLPLLQNNYTIYLETNGLHAQAMQKIRHLVDIVSMDFKLPSATGLRPFWEEHKQFLAAAKEVTLFVKAVVTDDTSLDDINTAARIIAGFGNTIPFIIQPAAGGFAPSSTMLAGFQESALTIIPNVRIIPQIHKMLGVP